MHQTNSKLINLKLHYDSKLKLCSSIFVCNDTISNYLKLNPKQHCTSIITKLRLSSQKLYIERGRYSRPKIPWNKKNKFCDEEETESHFIFCFVKYIP